VIYANIGNVSLDTCFTNWGYSDMYTCIE